MSNYHHLLSHFAFYYMNYDHQLLASFFTGSYHVESIKSTKDMALPLGLSLKQQFPQFFVPRSGRSVWTGGTVLIVQGSVQFPTKSSLV